MNRYPYTQTQVFPGLKGGLPFVPITLTAHEHSVGVSALVDSGSVVNVLPYDVGLELGLIWEAQTFSLPVGGLLRGTPAFGVLFTGHLENFPPLVLAFAWTQKSRSDVPVILGQVNFFQEVYPILFNGKVGVFELALNKEV